MKKGDPYAKLPSLTRTGSERKTRDSHLLRVRDAPERGEKDLTFNDDRPFSDKIWQKMRKNIRSILGIRDTRRQGGGKGARNSPETNIGLERNVEKEVAS